MKLIHCQALLRRRLRYSRAEVLARAKDERFYIKLSVPAENTFSIDHQIPVGTQESVLKYLKIISILSPVDIPRSSGSYSNQFTFSVKVKRTIIIIFDISQSSSSPSSSSASSYYSINHVNQKHVACSTEES